MYGDGNGGERPANTKRWDFTALAALLATAIFVQSVVAFGIVADLFAFVKPVEAGGASFGGVALRFLHMVGAAYVALLLALVFVRRARAGAVVAACVLAWTAAVLTPEFIWFYDFGRDSALDHWSGPAARLAGVWAACLITFICPP